MNKINLSNKPLIEAIFELRWALTEDNLNDYKIIVGSLYDHLKEKYPFHEPLDASKMPDEITRYVIKHRFRKDKDDWPLVQIGPGVVTLNDTENYEWEEFYNQIDRLIHSFTEVYPSSSQPIEFNNIFLRYINAVEVDYSKHHIFDFLNDNMNINMNLDRELFDNNSVSSEPSGFKLNLSYPTNDPAGIIHLQFSKGQKSKTDALIWEMRVESTDKNNQKDTESILSWLNSAHKLAENWFFTMLNDEFLKRFE